MQGIQEVLGIELLSPKRGQPTIVLDSANAHIKRLTDLLVYLINTFPDVQRPPRINIGGGLTACINIISPALERFTEAESQQIDIELFPDLSAREVYKRLETNQIDLAVVTTDPSQNSNLPKPIHEIKLRYSLVGSHNHPVIRSIKSNGKYDWRLIRDCAVAVMADAIPVSAYPEEILFTEKTRLVTFSNYLLLNAYIASGNAIGFTIPQFLTAQQRGRVQIINYPRSKEIRIGVRACNLIRWDLGSTEYKEFQKLQQLLKSELDRLRPQLPDDSLLSIPSEFDSFHMSQVGNERKWLHAKLFLGNIADDGRFGGQFRSIGFIDKTFESQHGEGQKSNTRAYDITGKIEIRKTKQCHPVFLFNRRDR